MKYKLLLGLLTFAICASSFATINQGKPVCPKIPAIKAGGFQQAYSRNENRFWAVINPGSNFGTHKNWGVFMGYLKATDAQEALTKGTELLQSINGFIGPEKLDEPDAWACAYMVEDLPSITLIAITPAKYVNDVSKFQTLTTLF